MADLLQPRLAQLPRELCTELRTALATLLPAPSAPAPARRSLEVVDAEALSGWGDLAKELLDWFNEVYNGFGWCEVSVAGHGCGLPC